MSGSTSKKLMIIITVLLMVLALGLSVWLLFGDSIGNKEEITMPSEFETLAIEEMTAAPIFQDGSLPVVVQSKYLWQYGSQKISNEKPIVFETEPPETSSTEIITEVTTTQYVPETYYEVVTNWMGLPVLDEDGSEVTEIRTKPHTVIYTEAITDENGEALTDENGDILTELYSEEVTVTTTAAPEYITDENGEYITGENGEILTEEPTAALIDEASTEVPRTEATVGGRPEGSSQWAQAVSDGDKYTRVKVYIDGEYTVDKSSVMTVTVREKNGLINVPDTLTYNLYKGTCSVSPTKKHEGMAFVTTSGGQTIVTLIIPDEARPSVANTTALSAKSTISTFKDAYGVDIDDFSVSVALS